MNTQTLTQTIEAPPIQSPEIQIDKHALKKLLTSKTPEPTDYPSVTVRCDQKKGLWTFEREGQPKMWIESGVLKDVTFDVTNAPNVAISCGSRTGYAGCARGGFFTVEGEIKGKRQPVRFDKVYGYFYTFTDGDVVKLSHVHYLVLSENCHAEVIVI